MYQEQDALGFGGDGGDGVMGELGIGLTWGQGQDP